MLEMILINICPDGYKIAVGQTMLSWYESVGYGAAEWLERQADIMLAITSVSDATENVWVKRIDQLAHI